MEKNYCVSPPMLIDCILMSMNKDYMWLAKKLEMPFPIEFFAFENGKIGIEEHVEFVHTGVEDAGESVVPQFVCDDQEAETGEKSYDLCCDSHS